MRLVHHIAVRTVQCVALVWCWCIILRYVPTVCGAGVAPSVKICTPSFMKMYQLLQNLKRRNTQWHCHVLILSSFIHFVMKGSWVKISWGWVLGAYGSGRWVLGACGSGRWVLGACGSGRCSVADEHCWAMMSWWTSVMKYRLVDMLSDYQFL